MPSQAWVINGSTNPSLYLDVGQSYEFVVNNSAYPFYVKTIASTGTANALQSDVTNNGASVGTITLNVTVTTPIVLFYQSSTSPALTGMIFVNNAGYDEKDSAFILIF
jgi:hypothetical protein